MGTLREYVVLTIFFTIVSTPGQPNILVDNFGHARIADFGLTTVTQNLDSPRGVTCQRGHTAHWTAPELMDEGTYSKEADIFAFAMVTIEVCCGQYTVFRVGLIVVSCQCRYSLVRGHSVIIHPPWLSWP